MDRLSTLDDLPLAQSSERGYLLLVGGMRLLLDGLEDPPSSDELRDAITDASWGFPNRRGDLGMDGFYVDNDQNRVLMFQSKYDASGARPSREETDWFLTLPNWLVDPEELTLVRNDAVLDASQQFIAAVRSGYSISCAFFTTGRTDRRHRRPYEEWAERELIVTVGADAFRPDHEAELIDRRKFGELLDRFTGTTSPTVTLDIENGQLLEDPDAHTRYVVFTLDATQLAEVFGTWHFALFRDNPRGPLGQVKVNKQIQSTLSDDTMRAYFHLLNNGLSAGCDYFKLSDSRDQLEIGDFQIVNGLQTTFTIWDRYRQQLSLDNAKVVIKLIEGSGLRRHIAIASNAQSPMTGWDFASQDQVQQRLQREFAQLPHDHDLYYEIRRGGARFIDHKPGPKVKVKEIAQAAYAFDGHPGEARDQIRIVANSTLDQRGLYREIFSEDVTAHHLILPWRIRDRARSHILGLESRAADKGADAPEWLEDSTFYFVWLVGKALRSLLEFKELSSLSTSTAIALRGDINNWIAPLLLLAQNSIEDAYQFERRVAEESDRVFRVRVMFRGPRYYPRFVTFFERHFEHMRNSKQLPSLTS